MNNVSTKTKDLTKLAIMTSLVCIATYFFKVPTLNGYTHLGDSMIFIAVLILGWKQGAIAGGVGAALADLFGGYVIWVLPTFFIKVLMAVIMGLIAEKLLSKFKHGWIVGALVGGTFQVLAYALASIPLFGMAYAVSNLAANTVQTASGIIIATALISALIASNGMEKLKEI